MARTHRQRDVLTRAHLVAVHARRGLVVRPGIASYRRSFLASAAQVPSTYWASVAMAAPSMESSAAHESPRAGAATGERYEGLVRSARTCCGRALHHVAIAHLE